ncbi:hypothetical protein GCM10011571_07830 [Marinithermofilum abyssi]|uniref:Uncharacterized protein n=1 Tax=Marinithermofilum abyssi TaxID=1571185 RepID=A0A8J2VGQ4_9BACL|nr:hypothetical protein GCM10011571_07830 [Marinithermofilum abyssi]
MAADAPSARENTEIRAKNFTAFNSCLPPNEAGVPFIIKQKNALGYRRHFVDSVR